MTNQLQLINSNNADSSNSTNWRISDSTREIGRQGLMEARAELERVLKAQAKAKTKRLQDADTARYASPRKAA